jgi:BA14K-like protein
MHFGIRSDSARPRGNLVNIPARNDPSCSQPAVAPTATRERHSRFRPRPKGGRRKPIPTTIADPAISGRPIWSVAHQRKEIVMTLIEDISSSRLGQGRVLRLMCGSVAFVALMSATPIAPASAQGAPAGLLRLEPPQPGRIAEGELSNTRGAYARMRDEDVADARSFCVKRFRSFDPGSGTYLGQDGRRHPCP